MIARVVDEPLDLLFHVEHVSDPRAGAVATFVGLVRDHDPSVTGRVVGLDYSAHPDAPAVLSRIAASFAENDELLGGGVSHPIGPPAAGRRRSTCAERWSNG